MDGLKPPLPSVTEEESERTPMVEKAQETETPFFYSPNFYCRCGFVPISHGTQQRTHSASITIACTNPKCGAYMQKYEVTLEMAKGVRA